MTNPPIVEPPPPQTTRANRLALVGGLAAVLLLVLFAALYANRAPSKAVLPQAPPPASPATPGFLDRPPLAPAPLAEDPLGEAEYLESLRGAFPPEEPALPDPAVAYGSAPTSPEPPPTDPRRDAYFRALRSPLEPPDVRPAALVPAASGAPTSRELLPTLPPGLPLPPELSAVSPPPAPDALAPPAPAEPPQGPPPPPPPLLVATADPSSSGQNRLAAGTLIPAALVTAVHSDLAGDLVAQVRRDVYDSSSQSRVLIPRGSRLLGRYDSQIAVGQNRLLVAWTRLLLPDGRSFSFPGLPGVDAAGASGLPADVNHHIARVFGSALLLSAISAGFQLAQEPEEGLALGQALTSQQALAAAVGQELGRVATEYLRRNLAIKPTLRLPAGLSFHVFLRSDLEIPTLEASAW